MLPNVTLGLLVLVFIPCLIWSFVMAAWLVPGPLLFQVIAGIYLLISFRGAGSAEWIGPLTIYVLSSLMSVGTFYLVGPISTALKASVGEVESIIVLTLGIPAFLCAAFFSALKRFI